LNIKLVHTNRIRKKMYTVTDLRKAVMNGQHVLVKDIVQDLRNQRVDFTDLKQLAIKKNQVNGGAYKKVVAAFD
jgi:hypothetical protein